MNVRIIDCELGPRLGERGPGVSVSGLCCLSLPVREIHAQKARSLELHRILGTFPEIMAEAGSLPTLREHDPKDPYKVVRTYDLMPFNETNPNAPWASTHTTGDRMCFLV